MKEYRIMKGVLLRRTVRVGHTASQVGVEDRSDSSW